MAKNSRKKIIWAVDVFESQHAMIQSHTVKALQAINAAGAYRVEPVYILSPEQLDLSLEFSPPWLKKYRPAAENALKAQVRALSDRVSGLTAGKVITQRKPSVSSAVKALVAYAKSEGASFIMVGSHAREGIARLVLGSFAETLLLSSSVPVVVVGPEAFVPVIGEKEQSIKRILFPTDFSAKSFKAYKRLLDFASGFGAEITLFHAITQPMEPVIQSGVYLMGGGWISVPAYMGKEEERVKKLATQWVTKAKPSGVSVRFELSTQPGGVVDAILGEAQKSNADLIAMAAQSGTITTVLVGSIARQVVRASKCPVWVSRS